MPHDKRPLAAKESRRWISTAEQAKEVLSAAATVTVIADRESDIYAKWATLPSAGFHLLTRSMQDRILADGRSLYEAGAARPLASDSSIALMVRANRPARQAKLALRFGRSRCADPRVRRAVMPKAVELRLVEVVELDPPADAEPLHWRLLTTHEVRDTAAAWRIVDWYKQRWIIEQLFRILKPQGLKLEDSRLETADRLLKLAAIATKAAAITLQLIQARDGQNTAPATIAFNKVKSRPSPPPTPNTRQHKLQSNPHPPRSLAWAAWIIARLGGWDGYPLPSPAPSPSGTASNTSSPRPRMDPQKCVNN